ncbi:K+ transport system, NAD-binding component [Jonquetella anthropi DSM 22815]|uniref:Trk system potassium uptake protein TrkA n=1 Tax=Jonquetella anthropi DSM 22815 TaxID=885272 RepID=H0UMH6_9BACT|nr:Trk system potassium transporter TrkA [Jonquetella anthropi]EEX48238.1 potassium transporter peripheral membrane component [Jonquetella anthropi E3_33 E1]EHM13679.1 K+ transport system, NAD-binding component [Jonquetella anthropi DSM 22815]
MKIVVVGAGDVGAFVAKSLSEEGHDVVVVEQDPDRADLMKETQDVAVVQGNGARPIVLEQAGVSKGNDVDALIACTNRDEVNLMAGWLGKRAGVRQVLARVRDLEFTDTPGWAKELGIDMLHSPERALTREIMSLLEVTAALHSTDMAGGLAGSFAFRVEDRSPVCGRSLQEVGVAYPDLGAVVVYVERNGEGFLPDGQWRAQAGDLCFLVCLKERAMKAQALFHPGRTKRLGRVVVVGGGKQGANLARGILRRYPGLETVLVDLRHDKCVKLAGEMPDLEVINGDGREAELLINAGVQSADGLVATTDSDEQNIVIAALAGTLGCRKTVAVARRRGYSRLRSVLPVDVLLNPNETLASSFLRHVRYPRSAGVLSLIDRIGAETLEFTLPEDSPLAGRAVMDLGLDRGALIALVSRGGGLIVPNGRTTLLAGDVITLFASGGLMPKAMRLFGLSA